MPEIQVKNKLLQSQAKALDKQKNDMADLIRETKNLCTSMKLTWKGEACLAYCRKLEEYMKKAEAIEALLEKDSRFVNSVAEEFESTDKEAAKIIRG